MAIQDQDFKTYQGDRFDVNSTVIDAEGVQMDISGVQEIQWTLAISAEDTPVVTKLMSTGGITLPNAGTDGKYSIHLLTADTAALTANYLHIAKIKDANDFWSTVMQGRATFAPSPVWTYTGDPRSSNKDAVRFWMGDTDSTDKQVMDGEINYGLTIYPDVKLCAAKLLRALASRYTRRADKAVGDLRISYSQVSKQYLLQADALESQANVSGANIYAGGVSLSDILRVEQDTDRPTPPFWAGQFDNPSGPNNTTQDPWTSRGND